MSDIHIDVFYKDACLILLQLYKNFPKKMTMLVEDIAGPDEPDEFGLASERHQACFAAMIWLAEAGYLSYLETIRQEALDQAVLSHKGFTLLTAAPHPPNQLPHQPPQEQDPIYKFNPPLTHITQLRTALQNASSSQLATAMRDILTQPTSAN